MTFAQKYLAILRKRGEDNAALRKVYKIIRCKEFYLLAYANLYGNAGALTPGVNPEETVDGMSLKRIETITKQLERGVYRWKPTRRIYRVKPDGKRKRAIGMPGWNDKLLQEVIRMVLEAYYEPQFRDSSHGFRPKRGCHTALLTIKKKWTGIKWFIEGDMCHCFDALDHKMIEEIMARKIHDNRFLNILRGMLQAGYVEDWTFHKTYSGTAQGGIASPIIANIVLNELDEFVEDVLIPKYSRGNHRKKNAEYLDLVNKAQRAKRRGDHRTYKELRKAYQHIPSQQVDDPEFRRLKYIRYADDILLGYIGTKMEAEMIKRELAEFLTTLKLELSEKKTLITHAQSGYTRFLNYEIHTMKNDGWRTQKRRSVNGQIQLSIPQEVINQWKANVRGKHGIHPRTELMTRGDYDIVSTFEVELQGLINDYSLAHSVTATMNPLRYMYEESLVKTLAAKHHMTTADIRQKYTMYTADGRKVITVQIPRNGKKPLTASFGRRPIRRKRDTVLTDEIATVYVKRTELLTRLLAETCELCGQEGEVAGHHIRKLKDLKKRYQGRKDPPAWVKKMIAMRRKTLFVCEKCHQEIHNGTYDGAKLI